MKDQLRIFVVFILFILMLCTITACGNETGSNVSESSNSIGEDSRTSQSEEPIADASESAPEHVSNNEYFSTYREIEGYTHTLSLENHMTVTYSAEFPVEWQKYNYTPLRDMERFRYYRENITDPLETYSLEIYINPGEYGESIEDTLPFGFNQTEYIEINSMEIFHATINHIEDYSPFYTIHSKEFYGTYDVKNDVYIFIRFDIPYESSQDPYPDINNISKVLNSFTNIVFFQPNAIKQKDYFDGGPPTKNMNISLNTKEFIGTDLDFELQVHENDELQNMANNSFEIKSIYVMVEGGQLITFTVIPADNAEAKINMTELMLAGGEVFYIDDYFLVSDITALLYHLWMPDLKAILTIHFTELDGSPLSRDVYYNSDIYDYVSELEIQAAP